MCFLKERTEDYVDRRPAEWQLTIFLTHLWLSPSHTDVIFEVLNAFFIEIPKPNTSYALLTCRYTFWSSSCKGGRKLRTKPTEDQNNLSNQQKQSHILALNRCGIISPSLKSRCNKMSTSWLAGASLPQFHVIAVFHQAEQNSSWPADWSALPL